MTTGIIHGDKHIDKQMGCFAGFFHLFDRNHILAGKRFYSTTKRITNPTYQVSNPPTEREKPKQAKLSISPPPPEKLTPALEKLTPAKILPELKEGTRCPWKFGKDSPRLSLDSRATVDAKGNLYPKIVSKIEVGDEKRRSTSVIARLMGLEPLPDSSNPDKNAELRRSASESRVSKNLSRFMNLDKSFNATPNNNNKPQIENTKIERNDPTVRRSPWKSPQQRKNYFDSEDLFPEPKQDSSICNEIERKLRMRGIDEPCKDLETLKQILDAMQLKGLLRNKRPNYSDRRNNYIYTEESPIVLMKPAKTRTPPPPRRSGGEREILRQNTSSPTRKESSKNSPNCSPVKRRPIRTNERASPVNSPRMSPRRNGFDPTVGNNRSPRNRRLVVEVKEKVSVVLEDESSSITESTVSTSSQTDTERSKMEVYKGGRSLLERCDNLLHSIAEMTSAELQPSPVSVLDSSFYKDESSSPSPIMKKNIDFKDQHVEFEDVWSPMCSPIKSQREITTQDCDYVYISDILRVSNYLRDDSDKFLSLEKQQYLRGNDTSKVSRLQRKLIFDTINEILDRNRTLPPWRFHFRPNSNEETPSISHIWSEFQKIKERDLVDEDLFDTICSVLRKDLAGDAINGWGDCHVEKSEAVLDIERLIFKDLVGQTIQDLATLGGTNMVSALCRKLVF